MTKVKDIKNVVLFHDKCSDGLGAAAAAYQALGYEDTLYVPANHNPLLSLTPEEVVKFILDPNKSDLDKHNDLTSLNLYAHLSDVTLYILDFCLTPEQLLYADSVFGGVMVIDHHITAYNDIVNSGMFTKVGEEIVDVTKFNFGKNGEVFYSPVLSGAVLAHLVLLSVHVQNVPTSLWLIQDRDLWTWELEDTKPFSMGLREADLTVSAAADLLYDEYKSKELTERGMYIVSFNDKEVKRMAKTMVMDVDIFINDIHYRGGIMNNANPHVTSEACHMACKDNRDIVLSYNIRSDGGVSWSARSIDVDASPLAKAMGGGGHAQACGFGSSLAWLIDVLETKSFIVHV